jgi:hypothetical protein
MIIQMYEGLSGPFLLKKGAIFEKFKIGVFSGTTRVPSGPNYGVCV